MIKGDIYEFKDKDDKILGYNSIGNIDKNLLFIELRKSYKENILSSDIIIVKTSEIDSIKKIIGNSTIEVRNMSRREVKINRIITADRVKFNMSINNLIWFLEQLDEKELDRIIDKIIDIKLFDTLIINVD